MQRKAPAVSPSPAPTWSSQKCKVNNMVSQLAELAAANHDQCLKVAELKEVEKTMHTVKKVKLKSESKLILDQECHEHACQEGKAQCVHAECMMELQICLVKAKHNGGNSSGPVQHHAEQWQFDPSL